MQQRVAIVGAGLAGLSAAWHLHGRGFDTIVVDARERVGGRVHTIRSPFSDGQFAEAGAARIGSDHTTTLGYVRSLGLQLRSFYPPGGRVVISQNGKRHEVDGRIPSYRSHELITCGATRSSFLDPVIARLPWPLSPPRWFKIEGGADQLPKAIAARLPSVLLGTPVLRIEQRDSGVTLYCTSRQHSIETVRADYVICTVPLSVIDRIEFVPDLSASKRQQMSRVGYQSAYRCFFRVAERFWNRQGCNGFANGDVIGEVWHSTFDQPGTRGVLVAYCQGGPAEAMAALSEDQRVHRTTALLGQIHDGIREMVETTVTYHWDDEEWSRGAQSLAWDLSDTDLRELGRPEGRIHFAGEHTAPRRWLGWMNGALLSGERAVSEIRRRAAS